MASSIADPEEQNMAFWNEVAPVHYRSYDIASLRKGHSLIDNVLRRELYPVAGKSIVHLQCHIGTDTLSLAMDGATVTGVDFSHDSLAIARTLAQELGLPVRFVEANVLNLTEVLRETFDLVYTTKGVLCWIRDLGRWGEVIAHLLKPGGLLYLMDGHPFLPMLGATAHAPEQTDFYFHDTEPARYSGGVDYADPTYVSTNGTCEWAWTFADIVNALVQNDLRLLFLHEHDGLFFNGLPGMELDDNGWWHLKGAKGRLPLTFSLMAQKPVSV